VRTIKSATVALAALSILSSGTQAQGSLPLSLFERYLDALRQQAAIPGLSAAIVQGGRVVWDAGLGYQDVNALVTASATTPYPILDLSQTVSSTVLLQECLDRRHLNLNDRVRRWLSLYPDDTTTVAQLLSHTSPSGGFNYDAGRFAVLSGVVEQCATDRYPTTLANEIFDRLGMADSVPGQDLSDASSPDRRLFPTATVERYSAVLKRLAVPYRVDSRGRPTVSEYPRTALSASGGIVSTVRDLARFDSALDDNVLLADETRRRAWEPSGSVPTGLGWFVQSHNGERVVWHFGLARDAASSLYIKVPGRGLTLILLANSDGLAGPYTLSDGDVTVSLFAQLFLRLFVA
jgi:CubicO group peptidase (beta-lactamase class C family)